MRAEDVADGAAAECDSADRLEGEGCGEQSLAGSEDDWMDNEAVFVDQAGLDQRPSETDTSLREDVAAGALALQSRNRIGEIARDVGKDGVVVLNLSGRDDKDVGTVAAHLGRTI